MNNECCYCNMIQHDKIFKRESFNQTFLSRVVGAWHGWIMIIDNDSFEDW